MTTNIEILPKIVNVVTTADLKQKVDIKKFPEFAWGIYDKHTYGGRCGYVRANKMQGKVTIFPSGKMISLGAKSTKQSIEQIKSAMLCLLNAKLISDVKLTPTVKNIVGVLKLSKPILIQLLAPKLGGIYEPDQFSALILKAERSINYLIFSTGKIIINGAKSEKEMNTASFHIQERILKNN